MPHSSLSMGKLIFNFGKWCYTPEEGHVHVSPVSHFAILPSIPLYWLKKTTYYMGREPENHFTKWQCFVFLYLLSVILPFHINHTFPPHYAQSSQISVLCVAKKGSKTCQIHFTRLSSCFLSQYEVMFSAFPSWKPWKNWGFKAIVDLWIICFLLVNKIILSDTR